MRTYEITNVIREGVVEETKANIQSLFSKYSLTVQTEEDWGHKNLWHPVGATDRGHYMFWRCQANPTEIAKLEHDFKLNTNILRSLVVRAHGK